MTFFSLPSFLWGEFEKPASLTIGKSRGLLSKPQTPLPLPRLKAPEPPNLFAERIWPWPTYLQPKISKSKPKGRNQSLQGDIQQKGFAAPLLFSSEEKQTQKRKQPLCKHVKATSFGGCQAWLLD